LRPCRQKPATCSSLHPDRRPVNVLRGRGAASIIDNMAKRPRYRRGDQIGGWRLDRLLGTGGNGDVWRATSTDEQPPVALKILRSTDAQSEPYGRFRAEVEAHSLADGTGCVVPMLAQHLPGSPTRSAPAWMSMRLARTIRAALGKHPALERVVAAAVEVADDLVVLRERGVAHRDIKPSNLFYYDGRWVIGDLGLATFPGKRALTRTGRQIGPMYFIAPEMVKDAKRANAHRADMFSLSQTLWVLATGQNHPPPGGVRLNDSLTTLAAWVQDPRVGSLDALLERGEGRKPKADPVAKRNPRIPRAQRLSRTVGYVTTCRPD
jgi:serine/threonine protein kinase